MHHNMARMGGQSTSISMNELSNHDHSRFLTRTNRTVGRTNTLGPEAANNNINKSVFKELWCNPDKGGLHLFFI